MNTTPTSNELGQASAGAEQPFVFPCSFAQRRLWFLDQLVPGDVSYTLMGCVEVEGALDRDALEKSLREIIRRHESLRTHFEGEHGEAHQVIDPEVRLALEFFDLRSLPGPERLPKAVGLTREELLKPFDLLRGPLMRVKLIEMGEEQHRLVVSMHHIISDGWSIGVLIRELAVLYGAFSEGKPSPLPELPIQYVDYTAWQEEQLSGERLQSHIDYWRSQLEGSLTELQMVTDYPRPAALSTRGTLHQVKIETDLVRKLRRACQQHGVTLYMALLAAFQTLLFRYSGQPEVLVGSPIAGRTRTETQGLIGFFVNTLVLKAKFPKGISFRQLLKQVKDNTLEVYAHQEMPFEKLVEELSPDRNSGRTPFFQAMLVLQNTPASELQLGSAKLRLLDIETVTAKFDMTLSLTEYTDVIKGTLEYSTELFDAETTLRFFRHFTFLMEGLLNDPDRPISQVPMVSEEERARLARGWSSPLAVPSAAEQKSLLALVADHARNPEKLALVQKDKQITYEQLYQRVQKIAGRLRAQGIQPGAKVGICIRDGAAGLVAVIGTLKAAAVAVPLDPEDPVARLEYIVKDAGAAWVLTDDISKERLQRAGIQCIPVAESAEPEGDPQSASADLEPDGFNKKAEAVLLYQSGPLGKPEGVVVPQCGLLPRSFAGDLAILPTDRVGCVLTTSTDENGLLELLRFMAAGATIVQLDEDGTPRKLASTVRDQNVTVLCSRAPALERLGREFSLNLKDVRLILCEDRGPGLERLHQNLKTEVLERIYCVFGARETCGWCALYPLSAPEKGITGHLAAGVKMELLDAEMTPIPEGIVGDIYVGGSHLALGYHGQPERTDALFPGDDYAEHKNAFIFDTGECGGRRADGRLELQGRRDGRGWISGVRVQPEEVESVLRKCEVLQDVAALVGNSEVSAFLVLNEGTELVEEELQQLLAPVLPRVMFPRSIHPVEAIPRLADGTVDRQKLKSLAEQLERSRSAAAEYVAPENEIERKLVAIWEQTLGLNRVGTHDDFFRIGGHSLLATQVGARISDELGVELPLRRLFEAPTIAQLAQIIAESTDAGAKQEEAIPQIKRVARTAVR